MLMHANDTNNANKIIYPELSYVLTGLCFNVHNEVGRYARERQYGDQIEQKIKEVRLPYRRELAVADTGNVVDFLIDDRIILEIKAKRIISKEDYFQLQRYLQVLNVKLGLLINFRDKYLKPLRVIKIDTSARNKFV